MKKTTIASRLIIAGLGVLTTAFYTSAHQHPSPESQSKDATKRACAVQRKGSALMQIRLDKIENAFNLPQGFKTKIVISYKDGKPLICPTHP